MKKSLKCECSTCIAKIEISNGAIERFSPMIVSIFLSEPFIFCSWFCWEISNIQHVQNGMTALDHARKEHHRAIIKLLTMKIWASARLWCMYISLYSVFVHMHVCVGDRVRVWCEVFELIDYLRIFVRIQVCNSMQLLSAQEKKSQCRRHCGL